MAGIVWWTPARIAALRALIEGQAMTCEQAARAMSRRYGRRLSRGAVLDVAQREGMALRVGRPPKKILPEGKKPH
jgi:hypothetical protein